MDNFIQDEGLSDRKMLRIAASYLDGAALQWWTDTARDLEALGIELTYDLFVDNCVKRWGGINIQEKVRSQLDRLRQTKSIGEYNNEFQKLFSHVSGEYSSEDFKIHEYVKGLKPNLQVQAAVMKFETVQECMAAMTRCEDALNTAQQNFQPLTSRPMQQKIISSMSSRKPFTPRAFRRGRGASTPTGRRLFVMQNSSKSSEQGLSSVWTEAVQTYGFDKARRMLNNEQCFKCGRRGHRANVCRSQQFTSEMNDNANLEVENEGHAEHESENDEGRDE